MVDVRDSRDLATLLGGKPLDVAVIIALRAVLRTLPFLIRNYDVYGEKNADRLILANLRALVTAWAAATKFYHPIEVSSKTLGAAIDFVANEASVIGAGSDEYAGYASFAIAEAVSLASVNEPDSLASLIDATIAAIDLSAEEMWGYLSADLSLIEGDISLRDLLKVPLYAHELVTYEGEPVTQGSEFIIISDPRVRGEWQRFLDFLGGRSIGWSVWFTWLRDRLDGRSAPAFDQAIQNLTEEEWKLEPAAINAQLKKLLWVGRKPAISTFEIIDGGVEGAGFQPSLDDSESIAEQVYAEFKARLESFEKRLVGYDGHPVTEDVLADIRALLSSLGESLADVKAGRVLQLDAMLSLAEDRLKAAVTDGQMSLPSDLSLVAAGISQQLRNFLGLFDDDLKKIDTRAQSVGINQSNFDALRKEVGALRRVAQQVDVIRPSAKMELDVGTKELLRLLKELEATVDDEKRAELLAAAHLNLGRQIRSQQNLLDVVAAYTSRCAASFAEGVPDGMKKAGSAVVLGGFAMAAQAIGVPALIIAALIGGSYLKSAKSLEEAGKKGEEAVKSFSPDTSNIRPQNSNDNGDGGPIIA